MAYNTKGRDFVLCEAAQSWLYDNVGNNYANIKHVEQYEGAVLQSTDLGQSEGGLHPSLTAW